MVVLLDEFCPWQVRPSETHQPAVLSKNTPRAGSYVCLHINSVVSVSKLGFSCLSDRAQEVYIFREMSTSGACLETNQFCKGTALV